MLEEMMRKKLSGRRVLLIGVGNTLRGDDAAGPQVIKLLAGKVAAELLDVGETPENYLGSILAKKAEIIVVVDAAEMGAAPGDIAFMGIDELIGRGLSTHQLPLHLFLRYVSEQTGADIVVVGIQPAQISLGKSITPAVWASVQYVAEVFRRIFA